MKEVERDGTMIGVDVSSRRGGDDGVIVVVGKIQPKPAFPGGKGSVYVRMGGGGKGGGGSTLLFWVGYFCS